MYYGRNGAGADSRALAGDANTPHAGQEPGERSDRDAQPPRRANWAWAAITAPQDWMDSHTPFAHLD